MRGHTPGPWAYAGKTRYRSIIAVYPTGNDRPDEVEAYGGHLVCESVGGQNVALIAAAPDLLEALENLENDAGQIPDHAWALIQSAIAKAGGKTK